MTQYKVIALYLSGMNNKVYDAGDIVTEGAFPAGTVPGLIDNGYLAEATAEDLSKASKPAEDKAAEPETPESQEEIDNAVKTKAPEDMNGPELKAALDLKGVKYSGNANKATLLALLIEASKPAEDKAE